MAKKQVGQRIVQKPAVRTARINLACRPDEKRVAQAIAVVRGVKHYSLLLRTHSLNQIMEMGRKAGIC